MLKTQIPHCIWYTVCLVLYRLGGRPVWFRLLVSVLTRSRTTWSYMPVQHEFPRLTPSEVRGEQLLDAS